MSAHWYVNATALTAMHSGFDWARRFDDAARERMTGDPAGFAGLDGHRDYGLAVPTPDHFIPALYLAGMASADGSGTPAVLVDGYTYGSLSMTAYTLGLTCDVPDGGGPAPAPPDGTPPESTNI